MRRLFWGTLAAVILLVVPITGATFMSTIQERLDEIEYQCLGQEPQFTCMVMVPPTEPYDIHDPARPDGDLLEFVPGDPPPPDPDPDPPPPDPDPDPPPPDPDPDPPPLPSGFDNLPDGWRVVNDNPWNDLTSESDGRFLDSNGWGWVVGARGDGAIVPISDDPDPDGDGNAFRMTWNPGHPGGWDAHGVWFGLSENGFAPSGDLYFAVYFQYSAGFKRHGNGLKMFAMDGSGLGQRYNMGWNDLTSINPSGEPCTDTFGFGSPVFPLGGWVSSDPDYPYDGNPACSGAGYHHQFEDSFFSSPDGAHKMPIGEWVLLEILVEQSASRVRWWQNGVLAGDWSGGAGLFPVNDILMDGTWGGGPSEVPAPQHWYIARSVIAVP